MREMMKLMQMKMMMKMMFPKKKHRGHHKHGCRHYSCVVHTQQSQLQQLMQMMMASAMTNQAPITISDRTHHSHRRRRRLITHHIGNDVVGVRKCRVLAKQEMCVTFDARMSDVRVELTVSDIMTAVDDNAQSDSVSISTDTANMDVKDIHRMSLFVQPFAYGMTRAQSLFWDSDAVRGAVHYVDTTVLKWSDVSDWMVLNKVGTRCAELMGLAASYVMCLSPRGEVHFERTSEDMGAVDDMSSFAQRMQTVMGREFEATTLRVSDIEQWAEVFAVYTDEAQTATRMCSYVSMVRLCVRGVDLTTMDADVAVTIEYGADQQRAPFHL